jgi:transmembrane sensor
MTNKEFDSLSKKFFLGDCSQEELTILRKIANDNLKFDYDSNFESSYTSSQNNIWIKLNVANKKDNKIKYYWLTSGLVASMALVFSFWDLNTITYFSTIPMRKVETQNHTNSLQKINLPDGSHVILGKNASILMEENFGIKTRTVYLTGEAFFTIKKNEKKPFLVHVGKLITEVIGTSFKISNPIDDKLIEVSVKTGKVSVYTQRTSCKKTNGVIITPNQKAVYNLATNAINESIVDLPMVTLPTVKKSDFEFDDVNVDKIFKKMQEIYGIEIIQVNSNINQCAFTGDLNGLSMFKQIEFICSSINASYEVRGSSIFINGEGCK